MRFSTFCIHATLSFFTPLPLLAILDNNTHMPEANDFDKKSFIPETTLSLKENFDQRLEHIQIISERLRTYGHVFDNKPFTNEELATLPDHADYLEECKKFSETFVNFHNTQQKQEYFANYVRLARVSALWGGTGMEELGPAEEKIRIEVYRDIEGYTKNLKNEFTKAINLVNNNDQLQQSLSTAYINTLVLPEIHTQVENGNISRENADKLIAHVNNINDYSLVPDAKFWVKLGMHTEEIKTIHRRIKGIKQAGSNMVSNLLHDYEANYITNLSDEFSQSVLPLHIDRNYYYFSEEYSRSKVVRGMEEHPDFHDQIATWSLLRENDTLKSLLGDGLSKVDHSVKHACLQKLAHVRRGRGEIEQDYKKIADLELWKDDPDVIARMILMTAVIDANSFPVDSVRKTLDRWSENKEAWNTSLEQVIDKYPLLRSVCDKLIDSQESPVYQIMGKIDDYALDLLRDPEASYEEHRLALYALTTPLVLEEYCSSLPEETKISFLDILQTINGTLSEGDASQQSQNEYEIRIRNYLKEYDQSGEFSASRSDYGERLQNMLKFGEHFKNHSKQQLQNYVTNPEVLDRVMHADDDKMDLLRKALDYCPEIATSSNLRRQIFKQFHKQLLNKDGLTYLHSFQEAFADYDEGKFLWIIPHIAEGSISRPRALEVARELHSVVDLDTFNLVVDFPSVFIEPVDGISNFQKLNNLFHTNHFLFQKLAEGVVNETITVEQGINLGSFAPILIDEEWKNTALFVIEQGKELLKSEDDTRFLQMLIGKHGKTASTLIRDYQATIMENPELRNEKDLILEFTDHFRVISPNLIALYKQAKETHTQDAFLTELHSITSKIAGEGKVTEAERSKLYYMDLLKHVYPNNAEKYADHEKIEAQCQDRSQDLEEYIIRKRYDIDLLAASLVHLKEGEILGKDQINNSTNLILDFNTFASSVEYRHSTLKNHLDEQINEHIQNIGLMTSEDVAESSSEEKLTRIFLEYLYGDKPIEASLVKKLFVSYQFTELENVQAYIEGTSDRTDNAKNHDYALLCELHNFYGDKVKEASRVIIQKALESESMEKVLKTYFDTYATKQAQSAQQNVLNRKNLNKLGPADSFYSTIAKVLKRKNGESYSPEQVKKIVERYERFNNGLTERQTSSTKGRTKAFYGQLKTQREKTLQAITELTGKTIDPTTIHLGEMNIADFLTSTQAINTAQYNPDQFSSYTTQRIMDIFGDEKQLIENELDKFVNEQGQERQILHGYITKSKESANARMTAGVCVSGDNPSDGEPNMWDMENFFQMVFQDPQSERCQGLVMLHSFEEKGKKVVTASINPSSTYLYQVDEEALFEGIMNQLELFASDNNVDMILLSTHEHIRTNRTGGAFEQAMNKRIASVNKTFSFRKEVHFSYYIEYLMDNAYVVWENPKTTRPLETVYTSY